MKHDNRLPVGAAFVGGLVGAAATAALLVFATPQAVSSRIVRQGLMADPQVIMDAADVLRDRQTAPVVDAHRAALETPFASSWEGAKKPGQGCVESNPYQQGWFVPQDVSGLIQLMGADYFVRHIPEPQLHVQFFHGSRDASGFIARRNYH